MIDGIERNLFTSVIDSVGCAFAEKKVTAVFDQNVNVYLAIKVLEAFSHTWKILGEEIRNQSKQATRNHKVQQERHCQERHRLEEEMYLAQECVALQRRQLTFLNFSTHENVDYLNLNHPI